MNNTLEIEQLQLAGWGYDGACKCSEPADKLHKGEFKLKISKRRDRWNLEQGGRVVRFGSKINLIERLKDI